MYERFTDLARRVMVAANHDAQASRCEYVGTEHVLIGLTLTESSARVALLDANATTAAVRGQLAKIATPPPPDKPVVLGRLPHTPRAKNLVGYAIDEAKALGNNYVGTEHLLLGLLRERESMACAILAALDIDLDAFRAKFAAELKRGPAATAPEANPEYIVAEVSKNWSGGHFREGDRDTVSSRFEHVIAVNRGRGYELHSWQLHRITVPNADPRVQVSTLNETIIAVFRRKPVFNGWTADFAVTTEIAAAAPPPDHGGRDAAGKAG